MRNNIKHTPGPWFVEGAGDRFVITAKPTPSEIVCSVPIAKDECPTAGDWANASLIMAAPDLLAACIEALSYIEDYAPHRVVLGVKSRLNAAIAKAEGGEA